MSKIEVEEKNLVVYALQVAVAEAQRLGALLGELWQPFLNEALNKKNEDLMDLIEMIVRTPSDRAYRLSAEQRKRALYGLQVARNAIHAKVTMMQFAQTSVFSSAPLVDHIKRIEVVEKRLLFESAPAQPRIVRRLDREE